MKKSDPDLALSDPIPLIPPGEYEAICNKVEYGHCWGGRKSLYLSFRIYGSEYDGTELFMAIPEPQNKFTQRTKKYQQWSLVLGRTPHKRERFNSQIFKGKMFKVYVLTTKCKFENGDLKPEYLQYSVVREILETLTGVDEQ